MKKEEISRLRPPSCHPREGIPTAGHRSGDGSSPWSDPWDSPRPERQAAVRRHCVDQIPSSRSGMGRCLPKTSCWPGWKPRSIAHGPRGLCIAWSRDRGEKRVGIARQGMESNKGRPLGGMTGEMPAAGRFDTGSGGCARGDVCLARAGTRWRWGACA